MPRGNKKSIDHRPAGYTPKLEELDSLSPTDKGRDYVKPGEQA